MQTRRTATAVASRLPLLSAFGAVLALSACASDRDASEKVAVQVAEVVGGEMVETCQWPSTVHVNSCTGTLIHPRVVTTAAHCLNGSRGTVTFGNGRNTPGAFSVMGECHGGAFGSSGGGTKRDWAYCVIPEDERVKAIPITPPLVGCEADKVLKVGATAWVVGWGSTGADGAGVGVKRQVAVKVNDLPDGIVDVGDRDHGACHGDSGGPIYMQAGDSTHDYGWRVVGSTSSAGSSNCDCTCNTLYVNISMHVAAIEQDEGIDVTPCTDADGNWDPSPDCKDFASAPQDGDGTFPTCDVPRVKSAIETCGANENLPTSGSGGMTGSGGATGGGGITGSGGMTGSGGITGSGGMSGSGGATAGTGTGGIGAGGSEAVAGSGGAAAVPVASGGVGAMAGAGGTGTAGTAGMIAPSMDPTALGTGSAGATNSVEVDAGCSAVPPGSQRAPNHHAFWLLALIALAVTRFRRST